MYILCTGYNKGKPIGGEVAPHINLANLACLFDLCTRQFQIISSLLTPHLIKGVTVVEAFTELVAEMIQHTLQLPHRHQWGRL